MYYCGVCKSIGRNFGQLPRFGLVNEASVLSLILNVAAGTIVSPERLRRNCIAHPFRKTNAVIRNEAVDYAAAVNVLLVYFKLLDSWNDDRNIAARTGSAAIRSAFRKAARQYPIAADAVYFSIRDLTRLEKSGCNAIDAACEPFAGMMAQIFKWKDSDLFTSTPIVLDLLSEIGYNVGKWIYLIDAVSDFAEDREKRRYNVLIHRYGTQYDTAAVKFILEMCLARCVAAWERLTEYVEARTDVAENLNYISAKSVADNLFYIGMRHTTEQKCAAAPTEQNQESGEQNEPI